MNHFSGFQPHNEVKEDMLAVCGSTSWLLEHICQYLHVNGMDCWEPQPRKNCCFAVRLCATTATKMDSQTDWFVVLFISMANLSAGYYKLSQCLYFMRVDDPPAWPIRLYILFEFKDIISK